MTTGHGLSMRERLARGERSFSFEFFPPKDEAGEEQLWQAITELEPYGPTFVSVTYGAGGATRDRTVGITERIARETSMLPVAHLTCVGHTTDELEAILDELSAAGVTHVMALRGDPPGGPGSPWSPLRVGSPTPATWSRSSASAPTCASVSRRSPRATSTLPTSTRTPESSRPSTTPAPSSLSPTWCCVPATTSRSSSARPRSGPTSRSSRASCRS